jgi:hypothetical protein
MLDNESQIKTPKVLSEEGEGHAILQSLQLADSVRVKKRDSGLNNSAYTSDKDQDDLVIDSVVLNEEYKSKRGMKKSPYAKPYLQVPLKTFPLISNLGGSQRTIKIGKKDSIPN